MASELRRLACDMHMNKDSSGTKYTVGVLGLSYGQPASQDDHYYWPTPANMQRLGLPGMMMCLQK